MKNIKLYLQVLLVALVFTSCSEEFLDVNTDPNNPLEVGPELILPVAQTYTAVNQFSDRYTNTLGNLMMVNWSQSDGFSWYYDEFEYAVNATFYGQIFNQAYGNTLKQYHALSTLVGPQYANYNAIGEIMKALQFQILVDAYGDIPYFEALQRGENPTPKYDDAEAIYDDLIIKLTAAINTIDNAGGSALVPGDDDTMFGGNMTAWKQFANTLKLRMLVRQSGMASKAAYIQDEMDVIMADGTGFITSDVSINPGYFNEENKQNPFYAAYGLTVAGETQNNGQATCASEYIVQYLTNTNDPRINRLYSLPVDPLGPGHVGVEQGVLNYPTDDSLEPEHVSLLGPGLLIGADQNATIFTQAEALFLQAEAAIFYPALGDPQTFYEAAITASFDFLGATGASGYYSQAINNVGWASSPNKQEAIITQKWIALNGTNGFESWVELNRTGYPSNLPLTLRAIDLGRTRPVRLAYPSSEVSSNSANLPSQPNVFTQKIFWAN